MKTLSANEYAQVRAFINNLVNSCKLCHHRGERCGECDLNHASRVLSVLDNAKGESAPSESSSVRLFDQRARVILETILRHGRCQGKDIDLKGNGTKQNKWFCLRMLRKRGIVRVAITDMGYRVYEIVPGREEMVREFVK